MAQQVRGAALDRALDKLLHRWEQASPKEQPITVKAVATALAASRTSLYKAAAPDLHYPAALCSRAARIAAAARRQAEHAQLSPTSTVDRLWRDRVRGLQAERDAWRAKCEALQLRIAGMEYHAEMAGWDASRLWQPLPENDRAARGRTTPPPRSRPARRTP